MGEFFELGNPQVSLTVNGVESTVDVAAGTTLLDFVRKHATAAGIRTFSVYVNGQKALTEQSGMDISTANSVEIVAKDSRG